ncbi:hypothetical protein LTR36_006196 [Oleoguttula mirabilis]|uniref:Uncharacterized protein n=1 Tax=Oleoguttula mirabilis TaxID=1507867 RepID=A0AAV9JD68_9PEZI|nr:hypothetical protein LTR36_006196 [Oleoguttula mirabilis]
MARDHQSYCPVRLSINDSFYTPRIYMTTLIGYNTEALGQSGSAMLVDVLGSMVGETLKAYPILQGTVELDPYSHGMRMVARMPSSANNSTQAVFDVVHHHSDSTSSYAEAEAASFAPAKFDVSLLCRYPTPPLDHTPQNIFAVQANFIDGGIIIAFQLHHAVADGRTLSQLANFMKALLGGKERPPVPELLFRLESFEDSISLADPHDIILQCDERNLLEQDSVDSSEVNPCGQKADTVQALLLTPASKIAELHERMIHALEQAGEFAQVSKNDALGAYTWCCITAARASGGKIDTALSSSCYVPVDWRKRVAPEVPEAYFGSATLTVRIAKTVGQLEAAVAALQCDNDVLPLAKIALAIRSGVSKVDTAFVQRRLRLALSVEAANMQAGGAKLQIQHTFDPAAGIDIVLSTLAPIFKFEDTNLAMMQPGFMRALHNTSSDGVIDVVPGTESGRMEMTMALSGNVVRRLVEMAAWRDLIEETIL